MANSWRDWKEGDSVRVVRSPGEVFREMSAILTTFDTSGADRVHAAIPPGRVWEFVGVVNNMIHVDGVPHHVPHAYVKHEGGDCLHWPVKCFEKAGATPLPCTCDTKMLMRRGCVCGGT